METLSAEISAEELSERRGDVLRRVAHSGERIGVTRIGKLAAVVIGATGLEALEAFELAADVADYRKAKAAGDGGRIGLDELRHS